MHQWLSTMPRGVFSADLYFAACNASSVIPCKWQTVLILVPGTRWGAMPSWELELEGNWLTDMLSDSCWLTPIPNMGEPVLDTSADKLPSPSRLVPIGNGAWNPADEWQDPDIGLVDCTRCEKGDVWCEVFGVKEVDKLVKMIMKWVAVSMPQGDQVWAKACAIGLGLLSTARSSWSSCIPATWGKSYPTPMDDKALSGQYPYRAFSISSPKDGT